MKKNKIVLFTLSFMLMIAIVLACKTPVYKYALQNWVERDYFQILRIYDSTKKQPDIDPEVKAAFEGQTQFTNCGVIPIDISQDVTQMYGEDFKTFLKEHMGDKQPPFHIIMNPKKTVIHTGDFKAADVPSLIMSPKRKELAEKLSKGDIVMILLESSDAEKNKKAKEEIKKGIAKAKEVDMDIRAQGDEETPPVDRKTLQPIGMDCITISPTDEKEKWFYRQMMKINPKITDDKEPKVFGVVGRGFVFEQALIGEYLTEEQIVSLMLFLSGPCSCTVKAENGGIDILMSWDWDKSIRANLDTSGEKKAQEKETSIAGFGGEEVAASNTDTKKNQTSKEANKAPEIITTGTGDKKEKIAESNINPKSKLSESKTSNNQSKLDQDTPVNESDFLRIVLIAVSGAAVLLFLITKVMKANKE